MKEALKLTSYANRPPYTLVLQCDKIIRKVIKQLKGMEGRGHAEPIPLAMV